MCSEKLVVALGGGSYCRSRSHGEQSETVNGVDGKTSETIHEARSKEYERNQMLALLQDIQISSQGITINARCIMDHQNAP